MSEKVTKKKGKVGKIFLIIIAIIALVIFGYVKYLDGAFNGILNKFEFSKDLVIQDLDIENNQEEDNKIEEITLRENCKAKLLVDDNDMVKVVQVEMNTSTDSYAMSVMEAIKAAAKVFKGVDLDFEVYDEDKLNICAKFAPSDIDDSLFEKAIDLGFITQEEVDRYKVYLDNPTVDNITELINIAF